MIKAIASTNVVINDNLQPATIVYSNISGKIITILNHVIQLDQDPELFKIYNIDEFRDVSPFYIAPGLVDTHVHLNEPGRTEWEGFATGSQAAISGGVTTIIDMPLNAIPPTTTLENFGIKLQAAQGQVWCDVGFWGGLVPDNLDHLVPLIEAGVRGFKGFLIDSGVDEFPAIDPAYIDKAMARVTNFKTILMFHAEMQPNVNLGPQLVSEIPTTAALPCGSSSGHSHDHGHSHSNGNFLEKQRAVFYNIDDSTITPPPEETEHHQQQQSDQYHQSPPLDAEEDIEDINLGMSQSFISRAPPHIPELLKKTKQHREDHANCTLPHNHAGSIDHSVLTDEQAIALARSPMLSAAEPKFGHAAELANPHHHFPHLHDEKESMKSPLLAAADTNAVLKQIDPTAYASFLASRPDVFETTAIAEIIACSIKNPLVPLHIVHLATHEAIPLIRAALEQNLPISVETCFHYLSLSAESISNGHTQFKCCPPIRTERNQQLLWQALKEKIIKTVVSDHSPCIPELKSFDSGDFFEAWGGISSIGFGLSILFTEGVKYGVNFIDIVQWCCENTAKQVGLQHKKGYIKPGYDADFAIFDPTMEFMIENDRTFFKNKITAYHGRELKGRVVETIIRGNSVFALGKGCSELPMGELILEPRTI